MLLEAKNAVIYGAGGAIGGAVARRFAREGANVFLTGRTMTSLEEVAAKIEASGGLARTAQVDALDEQAVEEHVAAVAEEAGHIDISFNAISIDDVQGIPLIEMSLEEFALPISAWTRTQFLTSRAAGRRMAEQQSGVILTLSGPGGRTATPLSGGFGVACAAIEGLSRTLAAELAPYGVRVICLEPGGIPETPNVQKSFAEHAEGSGMTVEALQASIESRTLLGRLPTLAEVANVAAFMASDQASGMTATIANLTAGTIVD
jgi:3-oxoacyl-[acyl-carrier protein] reductase